jgi:hypothetical protein
MLSLVVRDPRAPGVPHNRHVVPPALTNSRMTTTRRPPSERPHLQGSMFTPPSQSSQCSIRVPSLRTRAHHPAPELRKNVDWRQLRAWGGYANQDPIPEPRCNAPRRARRSGNRPSRGPTPSPARHLSRSASTSKR